MNGKSKSKSGSNKQQRYSDVPFLLKRIQMETPKSGQYFYDYKLQQAQQQQKLVSQESFHKKFKINFNDLPISQSMIKGLTNRGFTKMTQIQRCVIPHALIGRDIMAASRTGSGKTLCYLVPLVQKLYRQKFISLDGLGAIVIVPVRQLAIQVFQVLNSITSHMQLNLGLVIGGKDVQYQKERIRNMNILICTPGRILQHIQQTYGFQTSNLRMIILDQADVMMDMGFKSTLNAILENFPKCQTMLFSATLTKSIHQLANLSLIDPQKIYLHDVKNKDKSNKNLKDQKGNQKQSYTQKFDVPPSLKQYYMIVQPQQKLNTLYSFLKTHQKQKILVFVSTCKQARFIYESFKKFRLGCPIYEIQGHQKQKKRMAIYFTFCQKKYGILVSTNIASRGLDFPKIDWVIQFDIPEDKQTYIHRVGRTARYRSEGQALALVSQTQKPFIQNLKDSSVNIHKIVRNPEKYFKIDSSLRSICSQYQDIKYLAQRALVSYLKFLHKASNKDIFKLDKINMEKLSQSYGLINAPMIKINTEKKENQQDDQFKNMSKIQKMRAKAKLKKDLKKQKGQQKQKKINLLQQSSSQEQNQFQSEDNNSQQQEIFKKKQNSLLTNQNNKAILTVSKRQLGKIKSGGLYEGKNVTHFDDNMNPISDEQYRRRQYLKNNKKQAQQDRMQILERRKMQNEKTDKARQLKRRQDLRRKKKNNRQQQKQRQRRGAALDEYDDQDEIQMQDQYQRQEQCQQIQQSDE